MTKEQLIEALNKIKESEKDKMYDQEQGHIDADGLLLDYINDIEITKAFGDINKWYA